MTIIGGAGNLATGNMHIKDTLNEGDIRTYVVEAPKNSEEKINDGAFASFLWTGKDAYLKFQIETPDKSESGELSDGSGIIKAGNYNIAYAREVSSKGTVIFKLGFSKSDSGSIQGDWKIKVTSPSNTIINGYVVDVSQSWPAQLTGQQT
jgi:hypothetical protein